MANAKRELDLEERAGLFARDVNAFAKKLSKELIVFEGKQLVRAAGSVAASYIAANEALSRKDYIMRIKICQKEAKESRLWLNFIYAPAKGSETRERLLDEATQLMKIFGALLSDLNRLKLRQKEASQAGQQN